MIYIDVNIHMLQCNLLPKDTSFAVCVYICVPMIQIYYVYDVVFLPLCTGASVCYLESICYNVGPLKPQFLLDSLGIYPVAQM